MATLGYAFKHVIAACAVVCAAVLITVLAYFGLLGWAILSNAPLGSPAALPFWVLVALLSSTVAVMAILWLVTSLSEVICRKIGHWRRRAQLPIASLLLFLEVVSLGVIYASLWKHPVILSIRHGALAGLLLLMPLGVYWCSLQATDWILGTCCRCWRRIFVRSNQ